MPRIVNIAALALALLASSAPVSGYFYRGSRDKPENRGLRVSGSFANF
jgi:hypothetical protein